jgi:cell division protein FtsA
VRDFPPDTKITADKVAAIMDENRATEYPDQKILEVVEQEYRVDTNYTCAPVGVTASHLEANFLNILIRKSFFQNLSKCFEAANIILLRCMWPPSS